MALKSIFSFSGGGKVSNKQPSTIDTISKATSTKKLKPSSLITNKSSLLRNSSSLLNGRTSKNTSNLSQTSVVNSGTSNTSANTGASTSASYQKLLDYFKSKNEAARKSAIDAIRQRLKANEATYNYQLTDVANQYQALRNQSEVERYKARKALRESQANSGQLNSGFGRQENLLLNTNYGNNINSINLQEQSAVNDIKNLISQLKADAEADINQINNQYNQAIEEAMLQLGSK